MACGGGGVPVARVGDDLVGVDAVIDKDFAAALVGRLVGATSLLLLTGVEKVLLDFGTPDERPVDAMTVAEARAHLADGQFPPGSMGPKIEAAAQFVEGGGGTGPRHLAGGARPTPSPGRAGTRIIRVSTRPRQRSVLTWRPPARRRPSPPPPRGPAPCSRTRRGSATT